MKRKMRKGGEGLNSPAVCMVAVAVGLSLYLGGMEAAVTLPPDGRQLRRQFYKKMHTCTAAEAYVKHQVELWWGRDKTITAKLLKLLYADCMVNGCDASILLDGPDAERKASQNLDLDGFVLIEKIKRVLEVRCPKTVSCADILNLATRDALHLAGAPSYPMLLGRRDGVESRASWVDLPLPSISWREGLAYFLSKGLDAQDYATLLGSHAFGKTRCAYIQDRLYDFSGTRKPDPSMSKATLDRLRQQCPKTQTNKGRPVNDPTIFLTSQNGDKYRFTNKYYSNVLSHDSVLGVDQGLLHNYNTSQLVLEYAGSMEQFRREFALSISRMGSLKVLTGKQGEVRLNCSYSNRNNPYIN